MDDARIQKLIADACLRSEGDLSAEDRAALAAPPERLALYRRLVRNNLLGVTSKMMPRTRARVNDGAHGAFDASFDAFLSEVAPRTHYLRDVPAEFLAWVAPRWAEDSGVPRYAADLAGYELVHFQIASAPPLTGADAVADLALDRRLVFCPARKLVRYAHAIHELAEDVEDRVEPAVRDVALVAYRDPDNAVQFLELTPLAASIVERLFSGAALGEAVATACRLAGAAMSPEVLASTARMLADWGERGLLLGAEPGADGA
jgi:hypothetical protein